MAGLLPQRPADRNLHLLHLQLQGHPEGLRQLHPESGIHHGHPAAVRRGEKHMRVVINVKVRNGHVQLQTRLDQSSTDKVQEINIGQALLGMIENTIQGMPNVEVTK
jgi:hypothetical protein